MKRSRACWRCFSRVREVLRTYICLGVFVGVTRQQELQGSPVASKRGLVDRSAALLRAVETR